jgi:1,4-dihydroxy-2-naphthoate octaprenyltransferase
MKKPTKKYSRYGIGEWVVLFFGIVLMAIQIFRYATNSLADNKLEAFVCGLSILLMLSPLTLLNLIRKAKGIETK